MYGKCVAATTTGTQELKKDLCAKEFEALKTCFVNAVSGKASKPPTVVYIDGHHLKCLFVSGKEKSQMNGNRPGFMRARWSSHLF